MGQQPRVHQLRRLLLVPGRGPLPSTASAEEKDTLALLCARVDLPARIPMPGIHSVCKARTSVQELDICWVRLFINWNNIGKPCKPFDTILNVREAELGEPGDVNGTAFNAVLAEPALYRKGC